MKMIFNINARNFLLFFLFILPLANFYLSESFSVNYFFEIFVIYFSFVLIPLLFFKKNISKGGGLIDISFWTFVYLFFGLSFSTQLYNGQLPWIQISQYSGHLSTVLGIILVGCLTFIIGRYSNNLIHIHKRKLILKRVNLLFLFSVLLTIIIFSLLGIEKIIYPRSLLIYTIQNDSNRALLELLLVIINTSFFVCLIAYLQFYKKKLITFKNLIFFMIIMFIVFDPIRTERLIFLMIISILFLYYFNNNKNAWLAALTLGLVVIFPFADLFRGDSVFESGTFLAQYSGYITNFLTGDYDAPVSLLLAIEYVEDKSFLYGQNILLAIFGLIPRAIWISKPYATGFVLTDHANLFFQNIGVNLWAEFYLSFGFLGVALFFYLLGVVIKSITVSYKHNEFALVIYIYLTVFFIFFLRGDMLQVFFKTAPFIFFLYLVTSKKRKKVFSSSPEDIV